MRVLGDIVARDRRSDEVALRVGATGREYSYRDFCTTAWKAGHALSHLGVHAGARVALEPDPAPQPLLTLLGAACLGARVTFDTTAEARAVLVPAARESEVAMRPGRKVVVYGDSPAEPGVTHWERTVWSENPVQPPGERSADEPVLDSAEQRSAGNRTQSDDVESTAYTHREVLTAAVGVVEAVGLDADVSVALRASLTDPRAVVAGVIAPLAVGGTVVLPAGTTDADVIVGDDEDDGERAFHLDDVSL
jgi:acyl-CoA synthetase (AMP-forming)/AMP-acid ligase II